MNIELEKKINFLKEQVIRDRLEIKALRESKKKLISLVSNFPGMAWRSNVDYRNGEYIFTPEFISEGSFELTGYHSTELMERTVRDYIDLILPDNDGNRHDLLDNIKALKENRVSRSAYRIKTRAGIVKWVYEQGAGIYSKNGEPVGIEGYVTDLTELKESEQTLLKENIRLRSTIKDRYRFGNMVGKTSSMLDVYELILKSARTNSNVVILGETGTGKEIVAREIHTASDRTDKEFVPVNCGAIPETLVENEFFGHKRGAFTGAHIDKKGYLDRSNGGTLFLDEVGDIGTGMQTKLLRAIEDGTYMQVGDSQLKKSDFRVICATNKNLPELINQGIMREDFYYRICIIPITLPPLRERKEDIPLLVEHFLKEERSVKPTIQISGRKMDLLMDYDWPGNIRELQNVLKRYVVDESLDFMHGIVKMKSDTLHLTSIDIDQSENIGIEKTLANIEREIIVKMLNKVNWNRTLAASLLGIHRKALFRRMKRLGL
jgi:PAS domain S-box-containing protein